MPVNSMTPNELAQQMTPKVQQAAERAKSDIMSSLPIGQRVFAKALWPFAMKMGVPILCRIQIEFACDAYQKNLEPLIGGMVDALIKSIDEEKATPGLKDLRDILSVLRTPMAQFYPVVQESLRPNFGYALPDYDAEIRDDS